MEKFNTKQLLHILPMDEEVRQNVLAKYDQLTPDQRLALEKLCWTMFFQLYNNQVQQEFNQVLLKAKEGKAEIKNNLYGEIGQEVLEKLKKIILERAEKTAVQKTREKIKAQVSPPTPSPISNPMPIPKNPPPPPATPSPKPSPIPKPNLFYPRWADDPQQKITSQEFSQKYGPYIQSVENFVNQEVRKRLAGMKPDLAQQVFGQGQEKAYQALAERIREKGKYLRPEYSQDGLAKFLETILQEKEVRPAEFLMALEYLINKDKNPAFTIHYKTLRQGPSATTAQPATIQKTPLSKPERQAKNSGA